MKRGVKKKDNCAMSPIIATILLVAIVFILGSIVFAWMRGSVEEVIYKDGINIQLSCNDVIFDVEYYSDIATETKSIYVVNNGDINISDFKVQIASEGTKKNFNLKEKNIINNGLFNEEFSTGEGKEFDVTSETLLENADEILVIPVLKGLTSKGKEKTHVCEERFGVKRYLN